MEARREAGPGALVAWWPRAPGSPVPPPSPASESPCFQLACTGMSRSSAFACSCGRGFCSDGADCGDPLAGGFANFIQFGPIAARDRGAVGSSLFNLSFSCRPVPVSPHRALIQPSRRPSCPGRPCFFFSSRPERRFTPETTTFFQTAVVVAFLRKNRSSWDSRKPRSLGEKIQPPESV